MKLHKNKTILKQDEFLILAEVPHALFLLCGLRSDFKPNSIFFFDDRVYADKHYWPYEDVKSAREILIQKSFLKLTNKDDKGYYLTD